MSEEILETRLLSSLSKVFCDRELKEKEFASGSALRGEVYSFQMAYKFSGIINAEPLPFLKNLKVSIKSGIKKYIEARYVGNAVSELPIYYFHDKNVLGDKAGLYPDPLLPDREFHAVARRWHSLWFSVEIPEHLKAGPHEIEITLYNDKISVKRIFTLEVLDAVLPPLELIHTEWLHADCIASYYKTGLLTERHWKYIEKFIKSASGHGINMLLTPLFTPPLDTAIGSERPTVQLVGVKIEKGRYKFDFSLLDRWLELCEKYNVRYIEFSHLATQWGAAHCPKIIAEIRGEKKKIFGWDDASSGDKYIEFLNAFLPELMKYIKRKKLEKRCFFHVSDEPSVKHLENYKKIALTLRKHIGRIKIIDALSKIDFYRHGLVDKPVPAINKIGPFIENKVPGLWAYYCCSQYRDVSNRFLAFPSERNRISGIQLFKYDIEGFLHWGFNFYYSQYSKNLIDPWKVTDAGIAFPSGDAFIVYPGKNGPVESIHGRVFYEGLQDLRALKLLSELIGKNKTMELLEKNLEEPITFEKYPEGKDWLLSTRQKINMAIKKNMHKSF